MTTGPREPKGKVPQTFIGCLPNCGSVSNTRLLDRNVPKKIDKTKKLKLSLFVTVSV